eukprot:TRINITY_DN34133_c0_g1_i1.p1 TRINITY_DN34133_c0_g1~~TRINITY_DN34133_c0_g1_i1.p1  ORF type:complete len:187 (+),score=7.10 TRINITY_DN34133_c0_g1_i1:49-609(+)
MMMTKISVSFPLLCFVAALLVVIAPRGALAGCGNFTASDGSTYNLDPLTLPGGEYSGIENVTATHSYTYRWNFCAPAKTACSAFSNYRVTQTGDQNGACIPCGYEPISFSDHPDGPSKGVLVTYINSLDSTCSSGQLRRTTHIIVGCGTTDWTLDGISEPSMCVYEIAGRSKHACPLSGTKDSLSA